MAVDRRSNPIVDQCDVVIPTNDAEENSAATMKLPMFRIGKAASAPFGGSTCHRWAMQWRF